MLPTRHRPDRFVVGVDAGGTWVRIRAMTQARPLASLTQPASAVRELATFLHTVWRRRGWTRTQVEALVVAPRGVWLPRERPALRRRLAGAGRARVDSARCSATKAPRSGSAANGYAPRRTSACGDASRPRHMRCAPW